MKNAAMFESVRVSRKKETRNQKAPLLVTIRLSWLVPQVSSLPIQWIEKENRAEVKQYSEVRKHYVKYIVYKQKHIPKRAVSKAVLCTKY